MQYQPSHPNTQIITSSQIYIYKYIDESVSRGTCKKTIQMPDLPHQLCFCRGASPLPLPFPHTTSRSPGLPAAYWLIPSLTPSAVPGVWLCAHPSSLINPAVPIAKVFSGCLLPTAIYTKLSTFPFSHPLPFTPHTPFCSCSWNPIVKTHSRRWRFAQKQTNRGPPSIADTRQPRSSD